LLEEPNSKRPAKDRVVEKKPCVCLGSTKKRSTRTSKGTQYGKLSDCKGCVPLIFERTLISFALWVEKDQLSQGIASLLMTYFLELSRHLLQE
jgi:hypothetical protein